jgi:RHH-type transcriptional regulator, rel operon repressor / antitoxin RelB
MNHLEAAALGWQQRSPAVRNGWQHRPKSAMLNMLNKMLGIRLEPELEEKLDSLAKETGRSKSYYAREAIRQYLEDREDYLKGIAALERREPTITLEELERRLGLDD